jgi:hypothetical protein
MAGHYRIILQEQLTVESDASWLDGLSLVRDRRGSTILTGSFPDQAALISLIVRLHSLNLTLLRIERLNPPSGPANAA